MAKNDRRTPLPRMYVPWRCCTAVTFCRSSNETHRLGSSSSKSCVSDYDVPTRPCRGGVVAISNEIGQDDAETCGCEDELHASNSSKDSLQSTGAGEYGRGHARNRE